MSWRTIACCTWCWQRMHGDRTPVRVVEPGRETCGLCGLPTRSGIYVRHEFDDGEATG